ncbi:hypothetical protein BD779DRAFT_1555771 [Infundibulicybe gibba]|nr:hypothetical protein BD779DRAFT_1555771 [Infundibulicybe gibba]
MKSPPLGGGVFPHYQHPLALSYSFRSSLEYTLYSIHPPRPYEWFRRCHTNVPALEPPVS